MNYNIRVNSENAYGFNQYLNEESIIEDNEFKTLDSKRNYDLFIVKSIEVQMAIIQQRTILQL